MALKKLAEADVGLPRFDVPADIDGKTFALSSHQRAREALEFGLPVADPGFNIFVLGEDHSGRMTATLEFLDTVVAKRPPPDDWVYLNNFRRPHRPKPYRLPPGVGRRFRDRMAISFPNFAKRSPARSEARTTSIASASNARRSRPRQARAWMRCAPRCRTTVSNSPRIPRE